jgi:hypothetical protein
MEKTCKSEILIGIVAKLREQAEKGDHPDYSELMIRVADSLDVIAIGIRNNAGSWDSYEGSSYDFH